MLFLCENNLYAMGNALTRSESDTDLVTKAGASESDKDKAMAGAEAFARALPQALEELPQECGCLVLLRNAIAANTPATIDLTPALKRKVGL